MYICFRNDSISIGLNGFEITFCVGLMTDEPNFLFVILNFCIFRYFYSSTSYFRDHEQPEIFLSYLKGMDFS